MNRTLKNATVKRYLYETHDELRTHLGDFDFVSAYNFACRLKTLKGLTSYKFICKAWTKGAPSRGSQAERRFNEAEGRVPRMPA